MSSGTIVLLVIFILLIGSVLYVIGLYNGLVGLRNQVRNAWSQIDVQLKRRHDLIPNLVETAKGYMGHERETLETIAQARSAAVGAKGLPEIGKAEGRLTDMLGRFMAVAENYPELKANQNFLALQEELTSTENKIAYARQAYNDSVMFLNNKIEMFPSNIIAGSFGFRREVSFEIENAAEKAAPQVSFKK